MFSQIHLRQENVHLLVEAEQFADGLRIIISNGIGFYVSFSLNEFEELIAKGQQALQEVDLKKVENSIDK